MTRTQMSVHMAHTERASACVRALEHTEAFREMVECVCVVLVHCSLICLPSCLLARSLAARRRRERTSRPTFLSRCDERLSHSCVCMHRPPLTQVNLCEHVLRELARARLPRLWKPSSSSSAPASRLQLLQYLSSLKYSLRTHIRTHEQALGCVRHCSHT